MTKILATKENNYMNIRYYHKVNGKTDKELFDIVC